MTRFRMRHLVLLWAVSVFLWVFLTALGQTNWALATVAFAAVAVGCAGFILDVYFDHMGKR